MTRLATSRRALLGGGLALLAGSAARAHGPDPHPTAAGVMPTSVATPGADPLAGRFGGPFKLVAHDGRRLSDADFRGRFMLVYFGYTTCDDLCPLDLAVIEAALKELGPAADIVQPLFITVDPTRDTVPVMAAYVANFHPRLIGLTGSEPEIAAVARAYKVHRRKVRPAAGIQGGGIQGGSGPDAYIVDHGSLTYLMGPDGQFRTLVPHKTEAAAMAMVLRRYLPAS
ncbi:SCO family protein [Prosthecodimorpha staleyi]|uniref:SCO family protein n=1 Tax=Prosthecodimorpha staleyi TaxID=2840188 RepID=A0A947G9N5_9HYPH|nr:SCO family protein [Prosthecodimorpha staleyi]MBT9288138.1 SCO family protein [Prosthecodimorpha staleyi]